MDLRKLKTLIDLVSESGVAELEITEGEDRVRIVNRNGAAPVQVHQPVTVAQPMPVPVPAPEVAPAPAMCMDFYTAGQYIHSFYINQLCADNGKVAIGYF